MMYPGRREGPMLFPLLLAIALVSPACAHRSCPREVPMEPLARMDAPLRHLVTEHPDSVVGVLLRTTHPPTEEGHVHYFMKAR
jgi:hypothetical protein